MGVTLGDIDNLALGQIDELTLQEVDNLTIEQLIALTEERVAYLRNKYGPCSEVPEELNYCIEHLLCLTCELIPEIEKENKKSTKVFTINFIEIICSALIGKALDLAIEHQSEIIAAFKQAILVLTQISVWR